MPATNRLIDFSTPYLRGNEGEELRASSLQLISQLLRLQDVAPRHHRELLSIALWKWTEAPGGKPYPKYNIRYVSRGVLAANEAKIESRWQATDGLAALSGRGRRRLGSRARSMDGLRRYVVGTNNRSASDL
ncbi:hypothetical protein ABZX12_35265 [Kribbella sp. NPDC003505]|uniref:hypothetical protein n=1 Tax=Kribbella sp. NPDC003505 TaxID=3154448 RepID=UPI0033B4B5FA